MTVTLQDMLGRTTTLEVPEYDDAETAAIRMALMTGIPNKVVSDEL